VNAKGRLLGVDFGDVRVGLAVCDPDRVIASPLETYTRKSAADDASHYRKVIAAERIEMLVVGLPLHTNGNESQKSAEARKYAAWLAEQTGLPFVLWDERFTTVLAESALWSAGLTHKKRKERRDRVAAQMLLQSYLDSGCPPEGTQPGE